MKLQGRSIVAGRAGRAGDQEFHAVNPTSGRRLQPAYSTASTQDVDAAVDAAREAFDSLRDPEVRARFLEAIATELDGIAEDLVLRGSEETALPEARLRGELGRTTGQLRMFARVAREGSWVDARLDSADPDREPAPKPDLRSMLVPLGPVVVFGASNFPLAFSVAGGDSASAWAAGNPVIAKAHAGHPGTSELTGQAIARAATEVGLPSGVFSLLFDDGYAIGSALVKHPGVCAVGFTGSQAGGLALARLAAARSEPIPVYAEMGSVNPVIFLPGALAERGAELAAELFASCTLGVGQFCTNPGIALVPEGADGDAFVKALGDAAAASTMPSMLTSTIAQNYRRGAERLSQLGVNRIAYGRTPDVAAPGPAQVWETNLDAVRQNPGLFEEMFGPSTLVIRWKKLSDLVEVAGSIDGQLTATVHASEAEITSAAELWQALSRRVGRLLFGGFPTGVEVGDAMVHGGPFPASSHPATTSVGTRAIRRFARLVSFQNAPQALLPEELKDGNPRGVWRLVDGEWGR